MKFFLLLLFGVALFIGCGDNCEDLQPAEWRSDTGIFNDIFRSTYQISDAEWCSWGQRVGSRLSVPSPDEKFVTGVVQLSSEDAEIIREKYDFTKVSTITSAIDQKGNGFSEREIQLYPPSVAKSNVQTWLYSEEFMTELFTLTADWQVLALLAEDKDIVFVYFMCL